MTANNRKNFKMSQAQDSVCRLLSDFHAHRVATVPPALLQINIDQRALLEATADRDGFVKTGDAVAPFVLEDVTGGRLTLEGLLKKGPLVLIFFRVAGCPACNIALPYYQRRLAPRLAALGATLVAVSPQRPDTLGEIKKRHDLDFIVASDPDNALARRFGILFTADTPSRVAALAKGIDIAEITGTGTWELPMPSVIVIDRDRTVRFADIHPDWLVRTEAEPILEAVESLAIPA
jgi:peroxiredoxin